MRVEIHVTEKDIRDGAVGDSEFCAVALAIEREFPGAYVAVGDDRSQIGEWEFPNPPKVSKFLDEFDYGWDSRPFRFILNIPKDVEIWEPDR